MIVKNLPSKKQTKRRELIIILLFVFIMSSLALVLILNAVFNSILFNAYENSIEAERVHVNFLGEVRKFGDEVLLNATKEENYYAKNGDGYDLIIGEQSVFDNVIYSDETSRKVEITSQESVEIYNDNSRDREKDIGYDAICLLKEKFPYFTTKKGKDGFTEYHLNYRKRFYNDLKKFCKDEYNVEIKILKVFPIVVKVSKEKITEIVFSFKYRNSGITAILNASVRYDYDTILFPTDSQIKYEYGFYEEVNLEKSFYSNLSLPLLKDGSGRFLKIDDSTLDRKLLVRDVKTGDVLDSIPVDSIKEFTGDNVFSANDKLYITLAEHKQILEYDFVTKKTKTHQFNVIPTVRAVIGEQLLVQFENEGFFIGGDLDNLQTAQNYNAYGLGNIYYNQGQTFAVKVGEDGKSIVKLTANGEEGELFIGNKNWYFNSKGVVVVYQENNKNNALQYDSNLTFVKSYQTDTHVYNFLEENEEFIFFVGCVYNKETGLFQRCSNITNYSTLVNDVFYSFSENNYFYSSSTYQITNEHLVLQR